MFPNNNHDNEAAKQKPPGRFQTQKPEDSADLKVDFWCPRTLFPPCCATTISSVSQRHTFGSDAPEQFEWGVWDAMKSKYLMIIGKKGSRRSP